MIHSEACGSQGSARVVIAGVAIAAVGVAVSDDGDTTGLRSTSTTVARVIDGDTVEIASGEHVRVIGMDAPERGACGYQAATKAMRRMAEGREVTLVDPTSVQDRDRYGRLLRYVEVNSLDSGLVQIRHGRAIARYDSRDGYERHPREERYREADERHEGVCAERRRARAARWGEARRLADRANIRIKDGETAGQVLRRARAAVREADRLREARRAKPKPVPLPPTPVPSSNVFRPPAGWTTDALTPGYTGCRQGYPGGRIKGVYVWKPISC